MRSSLLVTLAMASALSISFSAGAAERSALAASGAQARHIEQQPLIAGAGLGYDFVNPKTVEIRVGGGDGAPDQKSPVEAALEWWRIVLEVMVLHLLASLAVKLGLRGLLRERENREISALIELGAFTKEQKRQHYASLVGIRLAQLTAKAGAASPTYRQPEVPGDT
jgi:hypothetical protein